jgi:hypothetical protein
MIFARTLENRESSMTPENENPQGHWETRESSRTVENRESSRTLGEERGVILSVPR